METKLTSPFVLLKQAWSLALARSNLASFFILGALPQLVSFASSVAFAYGFGNSDGWGITGFLLVGTGALLVVSFVGAWYTALLSMVYQATAEGKRASPVTYVGPARQKTMHLLVTYITVGFITLGGFLLLIMPGIILAIRYMFAPIIAAVEDRAVKPLAESKRLTQGRFWKLVGRGLVMVICYNVPLAILQSVHPYLGSAWAITSPIFGLYFYLVYADCKRATPAAA